MTSSPAPPLPSTQPTSLSPSPLTSTSMPTRRKHPFRGRPTPSSSIALPTTFLLLSLSNPKPPCRAVTASSIPSPLASSSLRSSRRHRELQTEATSVSSSSSSFRRSYCGPATSSSGWEEALAQCSFSTRCGGGNETDGGWTASCPPGYLCFGAIDCPNDDGDGDDNGTGPDDAPSDGGFFYCGPPADDLDAATVAILACQASTACGVDGSCEGNRVCYGGISCVAEDAPTATPPPATEPPSEENQIDDDASVPPLSAAPSATAAPVFDANVTSAETTVDVDGNATDANANSNGKIALPSAAPTSYGTFDPLNTRYCGPRLVGGFDVAAEICSPRLACPGGQREECPQDYMCFEGVFCAAAQPPTTTTTATTTTTTTSTTLTTTSLATTTADAVTTTEPTSPTVTNATESPPASTAVASSSPSTTTSPGEESTTTTTAATTASAATSTFVATTTTPLDATTVTTAAPESEIDPDDTETTDNNANAITVRGSFCGTFHAHAVSQCGPSTKCQTADDCLSDGSFLEECF
eukprot:CAMPEP_0171393484 /NCGR_PEP_ID=MMETSP0880-20121228/2707_1 /TAXON_ID=67004 /ORGANISM="Thalassiosira weissflogii, Strain CCMP1336" /LENGTH=526 /DNA_ID=CAMNT_0011906663 /DNA_START=54 /DNA_END=1631 /DNA_ORIENTATION=-